MEWNILVKTDYKNNQRFSVNNSRNIVEIGKMKKNETQRYPLPRDPILGHKLPRDPLRPRSLLRMRLRRRIAVARRWKAAAGKPRPPVG